MMIRYRDIEKYLANMWTYLLAPNALEYGFSENENERVIVERQNGTPLPNASSIVTFRIDEYDNWRAQRYGAGTMGYDRYGNEKITELRTFKCVVTIMSKRIGDAFDTARFLIANLQNTRYNDYVNDKGRLLGIERISGLKNLSDIENATWTERITFDVQLNFKDTILVNNQTLFVKKPDTPGEVPVSVEVTTKMKK